jgi:hypothetical protein
MKRLHGSTLMFRLTTEKEIDFYEKIEIPATGTGTT